MFILAGTLKRRLLPVFLVAALGWPVAAAAAEPLLTMVGPLTIHNLDADSPEVGLRVLLDGQLILKDRMMAYASVVGRFPKDRPASIVVLGMGTGGTGCPLMLRLIDVGRKPVYVTREFGTCYDEVKVTQAKNGMVVIKQPNVEEQGVSRWHYRNGVLSEH